MAEPMSTAEYMEKIHSGNTAEEILAGTMAAHEIILPRGLVMNDGRKLGIDYGGPGQFHMMTERIIMKDRYVAIHVDDDDRDQCRFKFKDAIVEAARALATGVDGN